MPKNMTFMFFSLCSFNNLISSIFYYCPIKGLHSRWTHYLHKSFLFPSFSSFRLFYPPKMYSFLHYSLFNLSQYVTMRLKYTSSESSSDHLPSNVHPSIHSSIYPLTKQGFTGYIICTRYCGRFLSYKDIYQVP